MSQTRPIKRRKVYLDCDQFFGVPASSFYKRVRDHAAATSNGASTSRCDEDDDSVDATAPSIVHSEHDGGGDVPDSSVHSDDDCGSDSSAYSTNDEGHVYCSFVDDDGEDRPEDEQDFLPQISGFSQETLPGSQVTKAGAIAAVMAYAISHGLTWTALGDLTKLINFLFGATVLPRSDYMFLKLWMRETEEVLQYFYVCETCSNEMTTEGKFVRGVNSAKPVQWVHNNKVHLSRPFVLCCSVDVPARAAVQNMVPFNGYFGCPWCLIRGEHVEGSMRYVTNEPPEMRTTEILRRDMKLALHYKDIINGVKEPSALLNLKGLDLVNGQSVEYMHCVLQGVAKQLTETILSSSNSHERFYVCAPSILAKLESRLLAIKPPTLRDQAATTTERSWPLEGI
ncbi:hypothetical protein MRX96_052528 [Rhipicephalus microplus]